ncbi:hypothetical protein ACIQU6_28770 [Streptomyces sp. NPDC090442]|uniref:hypothetical protein n=1 Tax=Streptomyces sp. NPDC090442 TaxID=3365962 RepID=UPI0038294BB1
MTDSDSRQAPFYVTKAEDRQLRVAADLLSPSLVIDQASSFDEYVRQMMVPPAVMDLAHKATDIRLAAWENQALRKQFEPALTDDERPRLLREILRRESQEDPSHPPYVRVACTGRGKYDDLAEQYGYDPNLPMAGDSGDFGSPVVLELWPAGHYSPMHSHGNTTGIIYCLAGQLDVMSYSKLDWNADKRGLVTLTPGKVCLALRRHLRRAQGVLPHGRRPSRPARPDQQHRRLRRQLPRLPRRAQAVDGPLRAVRPGVRGAGRRRRLLLRR